MPDWLKYRLYFIRFLLPERNRYGGYIYSWWTRFVGVVGIWLGQHWCDYCQHQGWGVKRVGPEGWASLCAWARRRYGLE